MLWVLRLSWKFESTGKIVISASFSGNLTKNKTGKAVHVHKLDLFLFSFFPILRAFPAKWQLLPVTRRLTLCSVADRKHTAEGKGARSFCAERFLLNYYSYSFQTCACDSVSLKSTCLCSTGMEREGVSSKIGVNLVYFPCDGGERSELLRIICFMCEAKTDRGEEMSLIEAFFWEISDLNVYFIQ